MNALAHFIQWAFWTCCDFMVNLGNLTHSSYHEANTWVLLLVLPGVLALLVGVRVAQWFRLRRAPHSLAPSLKGRETSC